jgi:hypothetical protein
VECVPRCRTCNGMCRSVPLPRTVAPRPSRTAGTRKGKASGHLSAPPTVQYFRLSCTHMTCMEDQKEWKPQRPKKNGKFWCDVCTKWLFVWTDPKSITGGPGDPAELIPF